MPALAEDETRGQIAAFVSFSVRAGAIGGGLLGALNQLGLQMGPEPGLSLTSFAAVLRALAAVIVSAGFCAFLGAVTAMLCAPLLWHRRFRSAVPWVFGAVAILWVGGYLTSVVLRALSGTYLSFTAIEFGLNGNAHLFDAALETFRAPLAAVATVCVALGLLATAGARRTLQSRQPVPQLRGPAIALGVGLLPVAFADDLSSTSPELALAGSLMPPLTRNSEESSTTAQQAVLGASLDSAADWPARAAAQNGPRPKILFVLLESVPERKMGYAGYSRNVTPNLDRLGRAGLRFRQVWATATHSNYAQMALLSSLFPRRGAGLDVYKHIDYPRVLLPDLTSALGYEAAAISSQDERWQGMLRFQDTGTPIYRFHAADHPGPHVDIGSELAVPDHITADHALSWLGRRTSKPWALAVTFQATHFPYRLPAGEPQPFAPNEPAPGTFNYLRYPESELAVAQNRFDNALAYVDRQIGRLYAFLEATKQLEDTLWVITSDHGELFHEHDNVTHGKTLYDAEARVPLIIHWPKQLEPREVVEPVSHLDVVPTVLDLLDAPEHPAHQGSSVFAQPERQPRPVYMNIQGLRTVEGLVCYPWKVIVDRSARRVRLFNLKNDPDEQLDLAKGELKIAESMRATLHAQMRAQHAYYGKDASLRATRFAPRMLACPPEVSRESDPAAKGIAQGRDGISAAPKLGPGG